MEEFVKTFKDTGPCEVDVQKVVDSWNDKMSISQWQNDYRLIQLVELFKEEAFKLTITKDQALEIISKARLLPIQSDIFKSGITWRSESMILSEIERFKNILKESKVSEEIKVIKSVITEYEKALTHKLVETIEIKIRTQGAPLVLDTPATIHRSTKDTLVFEVHLKSKDCIIDGLFGGDGEAPGFYIYATEDSTNLKKGKELNECTGVEFPTLKGWGHFCADLSKYSLRVCFLKK